MSYDKKVITNQFFGTIIEFITFRLSFKRKSQFELLNELKKL